jgi:dihydroflavonol-4-reductase
MSTVLVTGGSGFVGSHVMLQLLAAGHVVRTTLRSHGKVDKVRAMLGSAGADASSIEFHIADLTSDAGWAEAVAGCDCVMHVASPLPAAAPKHEDDVIVPARDGTLRVLRAARDARVKRVVMTSSCGAIYYGLPLRSEPFDETSWTDTRGEMSAYVKSKAIAERAAWDFIAREGNGLELAVINPAGIFGPALTADPSSSLDLIRRLMTGMRRCPMLFFTVVDVRDVADLHLRAMTSHEAAGQRFIAASGDSMSMLDIATILRSRLGAAAAKVPTKALPDGFVRLLAPFDARLRPLIPLLGKIRNVTSAKARRVLAWNPRPPEDAIVATAESLIRLGVVPAAP